MTTDKHQTIGISDAELDLDCVDEQLVGHIFPQRTMIQCGICAICKKTENMPNDSAPGSACFMQPNTLAYRIVHCDAPECEASARYIFNDWLAINKRFYVTKKTADNLFAVATILVPRSDGSITEGKIDFVSPFVLNDADQICLFCEIDNGDRYKSVPLENLIMHNAALRQCWTNNTQKFEILYEKQIELNYPSFINKIDANVAAVDALLTRSS